MFLCVKLFMSFFKIGLLTFGGGYAMLPFIQREMQKNKWVGEKEILNYYALSQVTPGIIAVNVSTFSGYKLKGWWGALWATFGVVTPSVIIITLLTYVLKDLWQHPLLQGAMQGIQLMGPALILTAIYRMSRRTISGGIDILLIVMALILALLNISVFIILPLCSLVRILMLFGSHK